MAEARERRFTELDGLRGIAALAVALTHLTGDYDGRYPEAPDSIVVLPEGAYGVQLFFMISGFVILMSATRAKRPSDFAISRVSRLYPPYWIALTLSIILIVAFAIPATGLYNWQTGLLNYMMVQRWFDIPNVDMVYWTLAIEMQFYILILILLYLTRCKLTTKVMSAVSIAWLTVALLVALWAFPTTHGLGPQYVPTLQKIVLNITLAEHGPLFIAGMFAYLSRRDGRLHWLLPAASVIAVVNAALIQNVKHGAIVAVVVIVFMVVALRPTTPLLNTGVAQFVGKISYSLYITHVMVSAVVITALIPVIGRDLSSLVALAVCMAVAWAVWRIGEKALAGRARDALLRLQRTVLRSPAEQPS